jgi:hypothetical protein
MHWTQRCFVYSITCFDDLITLKMDIFFFYFMSWYTMCCTVIKIVNVLLLFQQDLL